MPWIRTSKGIQFDPQNKPVKQENEKFHFWIVASFGNVLRDTSIRCVETYVGKFDNFFMTWRAAAALQSHVVSLRNARESDRYTRAHT